MDVVWWRLHVAKRQAESVFVVDPFINFLKSQGWTCHNMVAGFTTFGLADYWCYHPKYGERWIEFKHFKSPHSNYLKYTKAQEREFPRQVEAGVKIYCIAADDLRGEKNRDLRWKYYYMLLKRKPNIMKLFDENKRKELRIK